MILKYNGMKFVALCFCWRMETKIEKKDVNYLCLPSYPVLYRLLANQITRGEREREILPNIIFDVGCASFYSETIAITELFLGCLLDGWFVYFFFRV